MHVFYHRLAAVDLAEAVVHVHGARAHRFDFVAFEHDARFVFIFDEIFETGRFIHCDDFHIFASVFSDLTAENVIRLV